MKYTINYGYSGAVKAEQHAAYTSFTALENDINAAYWVDISLDAPIADTYIMIPACAYNGNRQDAVLRKYPPMYTEEEFGIDAPLRMTQVPRLAKDGDSYMDVTTGDMAMPCVCVFDKVKKQAFIVIFDQGAHGLNHGVTLEQCGDQLTIRLRAPAARRVVYRWPDLYPTLTPMPGEDPCLEVASGDQTVIPHEIHIFPCEDICTLYRKFFKFSREYADRSLPSVMPFSHYWQLAEKLAEDAFVPGENFFPLLSAGDTVNSQWQCGWVGGGIYTLPLICESSRDNMDKAIQTLEFAARCQSKAGWYYGIFHHGRIKHDCFGHHNDKHSLVLVRKHADLAFYMWKQISALQIKGINIPESVYSSATKATEALIAVWKRYGQLGQFINAETGEIVVGNSASGAITPAALCAAYAVTKDEKYIVHAREIADFYYQNATRIGLTTGGPGEILSAPDSESSAALLESYMALYEADNNDKWLRYAEDAAHQLASWVVCYDYKFPAESCFGKLGILANGSVWANVQNKHSAPGLCTLSPAALMKLYRATGNTAYMDLMRDIARFMPQVASCDERPILKTDGKPMASGEICERVNLSDWEGRENIGDSIFGGCTWPEVSLMLTWLEIPGVYVNTENNTVWASDHVAAHVVDNKLIITNATIFDAEVKVLTENNADRRVNLGLYWQDSFRRISVPAGTTVSFDI